MFFYNLQLLRFFAALLVLLFHLHLMPSGYKGVDLFFVISGFVMHHTLFGKTRPDALRFFVDRCTKIFFLYWVALALLFFIAPYTISTSFLYTLMLLPGHHSVLGVSWSLSFELYFYFLTGTIAYLLPSQHCRKVFVCLLCIAVLVGLSNLAAWSFKGSAANFLIGPNLGEFLLGVLSGYLLPAGAKRPSHLLFFLFLVCFFLFLMLDVAYAHPAAVIVYGFLSFVIVYTLAALELNNSVSDKYK